MALIKWSLKSPFKIIFSWIKWRCQRWKFYIQSFMYNHFLDQSYTADVCMEPMFWFVDNFTSVLGPFFVVAVVCLTVSVVTIAYWIGLPYWWKKDPSFTIILVIVGHWLLINNIFHYYMAVTTPPGYPPEDELITEAVSVCKKCISPKPPRTHHCSVCNRCILKMDHHCPWLNNCVGFFNHRYFYMYMVYTVIGVLFIILCGYDLAISAIFYGSELDIESSTEPELIGHPVRINASGVMIKMPELLLNVSTDHHLNDEKFRVEQNDDDTVKYSLWERRAIMYMALLNTGVLIALGSLSSWHGRLISHGETSIEANINKAETKRLAALGKIYVNPYDFGTRKNWRLFLGLVKGRSWFWNVILPSAHKAEGSGLTWHTVHDERREDEWP